MISFSEAQQMVIGQAHSFGKETVLLDDAAGRVIAEKIIADRDYPPFNRSSMDGFAFNYADWEKGIRSFIIREAIYAGHIASEKINPGECYKIMTGAAIPPSANVVIRIEDVDEAVNNIVCKTNDVKIYQHIARQGEDAKYGEVIISEPIRCMPAVTGVLATIGKFEVQVEKLPTVAIVTTGDEVMPIDAKVNAVQIRNSNSHVLKTLLKQWSIIPISCNHVIDDSTLIKEAIQKVQSCDILIVSGGVSAGDADYVPEVLAGLSAERIFHKVAIKPGKPIWFGKFPNGPVVFSLPGNPLSCMVTFKIFIEAFLSCSFGLGLPTTLSLPLRVARIKKSSLDEFFPVRLTGHPSALEPIPFNGSGDVTAALAAFGIARHEAIKAELAAGDIVNCYLF